jgi:hypothetical protein
MEPIEKTCQYCKNFDTFKCLLREYHDVMCLARLFCISSPYSKVLLELTADECLEVIEKCNKVCTGCDRFER